MITVIADLPLALSSAAFVLNAVLARDKKRLVGNIR
jgi:hypothetical protein